MLLNECSISVIPSSGSEAQWKVCPEEEREEEEEESFLYS